MLIGIDVGTQSLKAVVVAEDMAVIGQASVPYQPSFPRPGWAEQDPLLWEAALGPVIASALERAGKRPGDVRALAIAGQLDGCIATDADGRPLHPCLIWMDRRAEAELTELASAWSPGDMHAATGVVPDASHMAAKIRWLLRHRPETRAAARFHQPTSYLVARLTGAHVLDHGVASTTMLYGLAARAWDDRLCSLFEIAPARLPVIADAAAVAGTLHAAGAALTGLPAGIAVAVGTGDDFSTPLGAGIAGPGTLVGVLGTAEVVGALHPDPVIDPGRLVQTHAYVGGGYFVENPGWCSGGMLTWFLTTLGLPSADRLDELAAGSQPGARGVLCLPTFGGAMTPEWIAGARGCIFGLTPTHDSADLARAVLEGCAFAMRDIAERLRSLGLALGSICLLGGGARSRTWARIRADVCGLPVDVPEVVDTSPVGAAVLAAVASGQVASVGQAAARARRRALRVEPDAAATAAYAAPYAHYRRLFEALRPVFQAPREERQP